MRRWRERLQALWWARHRPTPRLVLTQRNIYIVPTGAGLAFFAVLLLLLISSINYQLNLGYALTFLLAGAALASMHVTHGCLRGLELHLRPVAACHAGQSTPLEVVIRHPGGTRHGVGLSIARSGAMDAPAWAELVGDGQSTVTLALDCPWRGLVDLPLLRLESRFPFGLFRAWSLWRPQGQACVWPAPEIPCPPLQAAPGASVQGTASRRADQGEFDGVRPWRRGDSPRQVAWKKVARSGEWISREASEPTADPAWLDLAHTGLGEPEARLSRLTAWMLACEQAQRPWGLRLGSREWPMGLGTVHLHAALRALAEY